MLTDIVVRVRCIVSIFGIIVACLACVACGTGRQDAVPSPSQTTAKAEDGTVFTGAYARRFADMYDNLQTGFARNLIKDGKISEYEIHPEDFGLQMMSNRSLRVGSVGESKDMLHAVLANQEGAAREIVLLNAGTALYAANLVDSIGAGVARAREAVASGAARAKLDEFIRFTQGLAA